MIIIIDKNSSPHVNGKEYGTTVSGKFASISRFDGLTISRIFFPKDEVDVYMSDIDMWFYTSAGYKICKANGVFSSVSQFDSVRIMYQVDSDGFTELYTAATDSDIKHGVSVHSDPDCSLLETYYYKDDENITDTVTAMFVDPLNPTTEEKLDCCLVTGVNFWLY